MAITNRIKGPIILLLGLLFACLFQIKALPDPTHSSRFLALSILITAYLFFVFYKSRNPLSIPTNIITWVYLGYIAVVLLSGFQAYNLSIYYVEASKSIVAFLLFVILGHIYVLNPGLTQKHFAYLSLIAFSLSIIWFVGDITSNQIESRVDLYKITGSSGHKNLYSSFVWLCFLLFLLGFKQL